GVRLGAVLLELLHLVLGDHPVGLEYRLRIAAPVLDRLPDALPVRLPVLLSRPAFAERAPHLNRLVEELLADRLENLLPLLRLRLVDQLRLERLVDQRLVVVAQPLADHLGTEARLRDVIAPRLLDPLPRLEAAAAALLRLDRRRLARRRLRYGKRPRGLGKRHLLEAYGRRALRGRRVRRGGPRCGRGDGRRLLSGDPAPLALHERSRRGLAREPRPVLLGRQPRLFGDGGPGLPAREVALDLGRKLLDGGVQRVRLDAPHEPAILHEERARLLGGNRLLADLLRTRADGVKRHPPPAPLELVPRLVQVSRRKLDSLISQRRHSSARRPRRGTSLRACRRTRRLYSGPRRPA